jgi:hypothetical protein
MEKAKKKTVFLKFYLAECLFLPLKTYQDRLFSLALVGKTLRGKRGLRFRHPSIEEYEEEKLRIGLKRPKP